MVLAKFEEAGAGCWRSPACTAHRSGRSRSTSALAPLSSLHHLPHAAHLEMILRTDPTVAAMATASMMPATQYISFFFQAGGFITLMVLQSVEGGAPVDRAGFVWGI